MSNVIKFDKSINKTKSRIEEIFSTEISHAKNIINIFKDDNEDIVKDLNYMQEYISILLTKINNKNWKISRTEEKFINCYDFFKEELKDEDLVWEAYFFTELIYFTDINPTLLDEDYNYISNIIKSLDNLMEDYKVSDKNTINYVINETKRPLIKKLFNNDKSDEEFYKMTNVIEGLINGSNVLTIYNWYKDDDFSIEEEFNDLQNGIITLDRVYDFYKEQEERLFFFKIESFYRTHDIDEEYDLKEHLLNSKIIEGIRLLEKYSDQYKLYYLELARKINSQKSIDKEIEDIVKLTNLYINMGEQITEYDFEDLNHYLEIMGGKNENRRL